MKWLLAKRIILILSGIFVFITSLFLLELVTRINFFNKLFDSLDGAAYNFAFKNLKYKLPLSDELVIIDVNTNEALIDRNDCARLISQLSARGAKVIALDILFHKAGTAAENKFITRSESLTTVVHSFCITGNAPIDTHQLIQRQQMAKFNALPDSIIQFENGFEPLRFIDGRMKLPFDSVLAVASGIGHVNFLSDNDHITRRFPLIISYDQECYPSLSLQVIRKFFDLDDDDFRVYLSNNNQSIVMTPRNNKPIYIPIDPYGQILVDFIKEERFDRQKMSLAHALLTSRDSTSSKFKNKIVLVINSIGVYGEDISSTPLSDNYPNWLIHASIISQILQHQYIKESAWQLVKFTFWTILIVIVWLIFIEFKFDWIKTKRWLVLLSLFVLLFIGVIIKLNRGIWPGFVIPFFVVLICYFALKLALLKFVRHVVTPYEYQDFEIHIQQKVKAEYLSDVIKSPAGEAYDGEFKLNVSKFKKIINRLQNFCATMPEVRKLGTELFEAVFQGRTRNRYFESLGIIQKSEKERLRIKLQFETPELMALPWEYCYDQERNEYLAFMTKISIVRYLLMPRVINPLEVEPPLKILVVCATPSDCQPLNVTDEMQKIGQQLKKMRLKTKVKLDVLNHATIEKLRDRVKKYHIIHFIGHGGFIRQLGEEIGCLMFENQSGKSDLIHSVRFSLILRDTKVRLVILNACETAKTSTYNAFLGVAPALVNAGIPAVIAMQFPMPDSSAVMFSEEFYNSLAQYYQVDAAVTDARIAMAERIGVERIDWGIPVLFMQSPDGILFQPRTF